MAISQMSGVIQHLRRTVLLRDGAGLTDGQLLEDYISRRDETALAALVHRHGPMVWGVCCRILRDHHDVEDAFQATFLVFVRKVASIASRELVANWIYGVAHQTALKARATVARRKGRERQVTQMPEPAAAEHGHWHDLQPVLDAELSRLPDRYRAVIVLCDLEGKTRKEAARQLACPEGTVAGWLARARGMLAKRLARRGIGLSGGALASVLSQNVALAGVPTSLVSSTIKAVSLLAAGQAAGVVTSRVAALAEGVAQAMFTTKIKRVLAVVLVVGLVLGGVGAGVGLSTHPAALAQTPGAKAVDVTKSNETLKNTLLTLEKAWLASDGKPGTDTYGQFLADDFVHIAPNGEKSDKAGNLRAHGGYHVGADYKMRDVELIRLNEKAAILTYKIEYKVISNATGKPVSERNVRYSTTWVQRDGGWLIVFSQSQDLSPKPQKNPVTFGVSPYMQITPDGKTVVPGDEEKKADEKKPAEKERKVLTPEEAIQQRPEENVTVQFKVASVHRPDPNYHGFFINYIQLRDGDKFVTNLFDKALSVERSGDLTGKMVRVTGRVEHVGDALFRMLVRDANHIEVVKE